MNLWQRLGTRLQALVKRDDPATSRVVSTGRTTGGEIITPDTALRQSAVWACLKFLSQTVGQLPWRVLIDNGDSAQQVRNHAVHRLLGVRPSPEMGPFSFKETMVWWAAQYGNAIAEIQWNSRGEPVALWPIHPSRIEFKRDANGNLVYEIWAGGSVRSVLGGDQVFHLRGYGDGAVGLNVMAYAAESIGWARATEVFGSAYFGNGLAPSGILKTKGKLSPEGLTNLKNELKTVYGGAKNNAKTMILDVEMDFQQLAVDPAAAQLVETRQHQVEEICRWFGVPPHKVMHLLRATFSNIEHQSIEVVVDSITPWALRLEQEADYKLFGGNRQAFYTKLDLKGLLRGDYKSRQEGLQIMRRNGVINSNEWRAFEDMNPIGDQGEIYIVEGNMTRLEQVGQQPAAVEDPLREQDTDPDEDDSTALDRARQQRALAERTVH